MIRLLSKRRRLVACAVLACVLAVGAYGVHRIRDRGEGGSGGSANRQLYMFAKDPAWFIKALGRVAVHGGTIRLPAGRVPSLELFALTPSAPIRIVGRPSTQLSGILIRRSQHIVLSGLRITPDGQPAIADVRQSSDITFSNVRFLGVVEDTGVALQLSPDDRDVTVSHAEFFNCQHGLACILAQGVGLTVDHVYFHHVRDADVIRGGADDVVIRDSYLHDALPGTYADNHNDLIQILGGGPWTIERDHFGVRANGAAQIYLDPRSGPSGPVRDVHVLSSLFTGSNPDMFFAIQIRTPASSSSPLPSGVELINNTIISANIAAVDVADGYADLPKGERPLIENNIFGRQKHSLCDVAQTATNVIVSGASCSGDRRGNPHLDASGRPTAASAALLAHGTATDAPATDMAGRKRASPPAIGAFELR